MMEDKTKVHASNYIETQFNMFSIVNNGCGSQEKPNPIISSVDVDYDIVNEDVPAISVENESPVLAMLKKLIAMQKGKGPKAILLPYKGALEAGIPLPVMNYMDFNSYFGTEISKSSFSNWINGTQDRYYTPTELEPYISIFKAIKS